MNVGQLKKLIQNVSDDEVKILVPSSDHCYQSAGITVSTALFDKQSNLWTKDYGETMTPEKEYGKRLVVLVID